MEAIFNNRNIAVCDNTQVNIKENFSNLLLAALQVEISNDDVINGDVCFRVFMPKTQSYFEYKLTGLEDASTKTVIKSVATKCANTLQFAAEQPIGIEAYYVAENNELQAMEHIRFGATYSKPKNKEYETLTKRDFIYKCVAAKLKLIFA
jgi:hypothetical protein